MSYITLFYLADMAQSIKVFGWLGCVVLIILLACIGLCRIDYYLNDVDRKRTKRYVILAVMGIMLCALVATLFPSKKTIYMMAGVKAVENMSNTNIVGDANEILGDLKTILHDYASDDKK